MSSKLYFNVFKPSLFIRGTALFNNSRVLKNLKLKCFTILPRDAKKPPQPYAEHKKQAITRSQDERNAAITKYRMKVLPFNSMDVFHIAQNGQFMMRLVAHA